MNGDPPVRYLIRCYLYAANKYLEDNKEDLGCMEDLDVYKTITQILTHLNDSRGFDAVFSTEADKRFKKRKGGRRYLHGGRPDYDEVKKSLEWVTKHREGILDVMVTVMAGQFSTEFTREGRAPPPSPPHYTRSPSPAILGRHWRREGRGRRVREHALREAGEEAEEAGEGVP